MSAGRIVDKLPDVPAEVAAAHRALVDENDSRHRRARQAALRDLAKRHPAEYADLFHRQKHARGAAHRHDVSDPETIYPPEGGADGPQ